MAESGVEERRDQTREVMRALGEHVATLSREISSFRESMHAMECEMGNVRTDLAVLKSQSLDVSNKVGAAGLSMEGIAGYRDRLSALEGTVGWMSKLIYILAVPALGGFIAALWELITKQFP